MTPLLSAEQAVLGSVLLAPNQLSHLTWLTPDHFHRPIHRALFAALLKLHSAGHPALSAKPQVTLSWVTDAVDEAGLHVRGLTAAYAHTLIQACPRSEHAPVYGRMVLEGAINRTVAEHAIRLHQAARADAVQGEVEGALRSADVLTEVLTDLARRWGTYPRPVAPTDAPAASQSSPSDQAAEDEQFLLAVLTGQPRAMDEVVAWLRPGDFADPGHNQLYRCLGALHHRCEPIDRITLLWEAQRRGLLTGGTLSAEQLTSICEGMVPGSAEWFGQRVMRSSLTRTAAACARAVQALAEDETLAPGRMINNALHALGSLGEVRARWRDANGHASPSRAPRAAPAPNARVQAALARSAPQTVTRAWARPPPAPEPAGSRAPSRRHG
ncbi:DnaB-like helicase N-terminal domain-containing protein [Streptomyces sp. NPDC003660]